MGKSTTVRLEVHYTALLRHVQFHCETLLVKNFPTAGSMKIFFYAQHDNIVSTSCESPAQLSSVREREREDTACRQPDSLYGLLALAYDAAEDGQKWSHSSPSL